MTASLNYEVLCASDEPLVPLLVHIPHSSTVVPADVRHGLLLDDIELERELLVMTDWYTDQLFNHVLDVGGTMFVNRWSRLVVDPERFPNDAEEIMAVRGMGAVYIKTSNGRILRNDELNLNREELLSRYFHPYAEAMANQVDRILDRHGHCLIVDGHSFASKPLSYELDQTSDRPELCIGTDAVHTSPKLIQAIEEISASEGVITACNRPFSGTYVPLPFWHKDRRVAGVMIEIRRDLYMDEATGEPIDRFLQVRGLVNRIIDVAVSLSLEN